ncbi:MAG TPA: phage exclusion protein Lit family protein [Rhizomicrobium sp.]|nr:phage exclusion protein Lit family protein [Rhizomicrobium sp.]
MLEVIPKEGDVTILCYELLLRSAPERVAELDRLFKLGIGIQFSKSARPTLGVIDGTVCISEGFLQQIWLLSHAAWLDFENFEKQKKMGSLLPADELIQLRQAIEAAEKIGDLFAPKWPESIPQHREEREGMEAKAIREIYAMATCWAVLHEMKHAELFTCLAKIADPHEEESACDGYAFDFLFVEIAEYEKRSGDAEGRVLGKRSIAALVGLYFVARLSKDGVPSETHPHVQTRIRSLFEKVGDLAVLHFWDFSIALLCGLRPEISQSAVELEKPTSKDLAYLALERAFPGHV